MRGIGSVNVNTVTTPSVAVNRSETHRSYSDFWYSLYETHAVVTKFDPAGATKRKLRHANEHARTDGAPELEQMGDRPRPA